MILDSKHIGWGHKFDLLGSRDVLSHVLSHMTIRFP